MAEAQAHVFVSGTVQGVNFRYYTVQQAQREAVTGWVRNLWDGRVEAVFEGEEAAVKRMVAWCDHGPPAAQVLKVDVTWREAQGSFQDFRVRMTGKWG